MTPASARSVAPPALLVVPGAICRGSARRAAGRAGARHRLGRASRAAAHRGGPRRAAAHRPAPAITVIACLVLGTPLAWLLARVDFPGRSVLRAAVAVPLVLPPVVAGVALVTAFGRNGADRCASSTAVTDPLHDLRGRARAHLRLDCRSTCSPSRGHCAPPASRTTWWPPPWAPTAGRPSAASPSRSRCPACWPGARWRGLARWASSAPPSPSPATTRAPRRRCRSLIYVALQSDPDRRPDPQPGPAGRLGRHPGRAAQPVAGRAVTGPASGRVADVRVPGRHAG